MEEPIILETSQGREITVPGWTRAGRSQKVLFVDYGDGVPDYEAVSVRLVYYSVKEGAPRGEIDIYINDTKYMYIGAYEISNGILLGMQDKYGIDRDGNK